MVSCGGEKMSKSLGNVVTIRKVAETHDLEALRLLFLGVHYRSAVGFTIGRDDAEAAASIPSSTRPRTRLAYFYRNARPAGRGARGRRRAAAVLRRAAQADKTLAAFREAMDDDFNTAAAIGQLYESFVLANKLLDDPKAAPKDVRRRTLARLRRDLLKCGETLGFSGARPPSSCWPAATASACGWASTPPPSRRRSQERAAARAAKDFARADEIRKALQRAAASS